MTDLSFRFAAENDLVFIRQLSAKVFSVYGNYDEIVTAWFFLPGVITVIAVEKTDPLGFAVLGFEIPGKREMPRGELLAIAVVPEYQRAGIGAALLAHVQSLAFEHGLNEICLCTAEDNSAARSFFEKAGFKVIGSQGRYYPRGQSALAMCKRLAP